MATRSGNVDPGMLLELMREEYSEDQMARILQKESGLKGLSGLSGDMREIREAAADGHNGAIKPSRSSATGSFSCSVPWLARCGALMCWPHRWDRGARQCAAVGASGRPGLVGCGGGNADRAGG